MKDKNYVLSSLCLIAVILILVCVIFVQLINRIEHIEKDNRSQESRLQDCYYAFMANPHSWEAFSTPYMKKKWTADPPKHHNYGGTIYEWKPDSEEVFTVRFPE